MTSNSRFTLSLGLAAVMMASVIFTCVPAGAQITIVNQVQGWMGGVKTDITTTENGATMLQYDATGVDKLVFGFGSEAGFNNQLMTLTGATFNGVALTQAVQNNFAPLNPTPPPTTTTDGGTGSIWYLDNPAQVTGTLNISFTTTGGQPNGGIASIFGLADTLPGVGNIGDTWTSQGAAGNVSTSLTTSAANSLVIALVENSGSNNGAGIPSAVGPLTQSVNGEWGSQWGSLATGYQSVPLSGTNVTPTFSTNAAGSIHVVAAEFLAAGGGDPPPTPVTLLSTDFTGRTVAGDTASNITWVTDGIADPGDLTAIPVSGGTFGGLFDTANAQGHFAPDRNTGNEGPWSVDIPISLTTAEVEINEVVIDWQHFNNSGNNQTANRAVDWTATLIGSDSGVIAMEELLNINGISGMETFDFGGITLTDDETWILQILAEGSNGTGNNTGLDAINVIGFANAAVVPEPASVAIWSLIGLGLAGFGVYRARRKK